MRFRNGLWLWITRVNTYFFSPSKRWVSLAQMSFFSAPFCVVVYVSLTHIQWVQQGPLMELPILRCPALCQTPHFLSRCQIDAQGHTSSIKTLGQKSALVLFTSESLWSLLRLDIFILFCYLSDAFKNNSNILSDILFYSNRLFSVSNLSYCLLPLFQR